MACITERSDTGVTIIMCGRGERPGKCHYCSRPHTKLCDFVTGTEQAGIATINTTCDRRLCGQCARHTEPDRDVCRIHPVPPAAP